MDLDNELINNQDVTKNHDTVIFNDQTKMTMTIGLDGLLESPDAKSIFKNGKSKVHPKLGNQEYIDDYGTHDKFIKTKQKPRLENEYDNGVNATIVPDSGKYDSRSKFHLRDEGDESKTGMHSQESVFDTKKKSASSDSDVFKGKFKNNNFKYGED